MTLDTNEEYYARFGPLVSQGLTDVLPRDSL